MIASLAVNNLPIEPHNGGRDPLTNLTNTVVKRARMTKSMWFVAVMGVTFLVGIVALSYTPIVQNEILKSADIRVAFWIAFGATIALLLAFGVTEIYLNIKHSRGLEG